MVSLVAWSKISIGSRNPAKNIAKMATAFLHENSINKSDIGLLIHSGVYRINFRAEPAFAPNIQKYMGLGDNEISPQSNHVFSFDVLDGTCGPHHAIQTCFNMLTANMLFWLSLMKNQILCTSLEIFLHALFVHSLEKEISNYKNPNSGI